MPDNPQSGRNPPERISYDLDQSLTLLATLEDTWNVLVLGRYLVVVLAIEDEIRVLNGKLGFGDL